MDEDNEAENLEFNNEDDIIQYLMAEHEIEKSATSAKVLFILLYFLNFSTRERFVVTYVKVLKEKNGARFVEELLFLFYCLHVLCNVFDDSNEQALNYVYSELSKVAMAHAERVKILASRRVL